MLPVPLWLIVDCVALMDERMRRGGGDSQGLPERDWEALRAALDTMLPVVRQGEPAGGHDVPV